MTDSLSSSEDTKIKESGPLQEQINMLTTIVSSKESQCSDVLQGFIESSDSQVAQLIINHGELFEVRFAVFLGVFFFKGYRKNALSKRFVAWVTQVVISFLNLLNSK